MVSWKTNEISFIKFHINDIKDYLQLINNSKTQHKKHSINYRSNAKKRLILIFWIPNILWNTKYFLMTKAKYFSHFWIFLWYIYINMLFYFIIHSFLSFYKKTRRGIETAKPNGLLSQTIYTRDLTNKVSQ